MTCTWWGDKESTIKDFRDPPVGILCFKLLSKWNYPLFPQLRSRGSVTDTEVRQDQSRLRQEHLLGPNWSLLQLMASCGCVFTSHLFCVLCFPAPETRESHFKSLFPQLSVSVLPRLSVCVLLFSSSLRNKRSWPPPSSSTTTHTWSPSPKPAITW